MSRRKWFVALFVALTFLLLSLAAAPGQVATAAPVAPATPVAAPAANECRPAKIITALRNERQLEAFGLHRDIFGSGALSFGREGRALYASLSVAEDLSGNPVGARITEVDTSLPPELRTKCWQPTDKVRIFAKYTIRFEQAERPPGLTETVFLWNSPFGETSLLPLTAIGVSRSANFPGYVATISQDVTFLPEFSGFSLLAPMPEWLDPTAWHTVHVQLAEQEATISVLQGDRRATVLSTALPQPLEPLAFEASVDNELFPGTYAPVSQPETIDVAAVAIRRFQKRGKH